MAEPAGSVGRHRHTRLDVLCFTALHRCGVFCEPRACGKPVSSESVSAVFLTASFFNPCCFLTLNCFFLDTMLLHAEQITV